jgi:hypothetical protein
MPSLNFMTGEDPLSLDRIRSVLVRLEDTIIFSLIERAQFTHSPRIYQKGSFKELLDIGFTGTWLDWFLKETEIFHGEIKKLDFCNPSYNNYYFFLRSKSSSLYEVRAYSAQNLLTHQSITEPFLLV